MATITAQQVLDENGWDTDDISLETLEYLIDNAINYVNLETGLSITNLAGVAASKSTTVTNDQDVVVKMVAGILVRAFKDKGPNVGISALNMSMISTDPHYRIFMQFIRMGLQRLRGRSFDRV